MTHENDLMIRFVEHRGYAEGELIRVHRVGDCRRRAEPWKIEGYGIKPLTESCLEISVRSPPAMKCQHLQWGLPEALTKQLTIGKGTQHGRPEGSEGKK
jgi:hypothetical protein